MDSTNQSLGKWGTQVFEIIESTLAKDKAITSHILLCFGEIDIRTQAVSRAILNKTKLDESVQVIGERILEFSKLLYQKFQIPVLIWEPTPTGKLYNSDLPATGTEVERNYATRQLGQSLKDGVARLQKKYRIFSFGAFDKLSFALHTSDEYFVDACHLNFSGLRIALAELEKLDEKHGLDVMPFFQVDDIKLKGLSRVVDITDQITFSMSSKLGADHSLKRSSVHGYCFHTDKEQTPHVLLDLGCARIINCIRLRNRLDGHTERAAHLAVSIGNDPQKLERIYQTDKTWGADGGILELDFPPEPIRLISLRILAKDYFHLGEVTVFARGFL